MTKTWPLFVKLLEGCSPLINYKVVRWIRPSSGTYKCNTDGLGIDSFAFCVKNEEGYFLYAETRAIKDVLVIESEIKAFNNGPRLLFA